MYLNDVSLVQTTAADKVAADKILELNSEGRVTVGDIKMYYQVYGRGEPLLLIMGLGGHSLDWG